MKGGTRWWRGAAPPKPSLLLLWVLAGCASTAAHTGAEHAAPRIRAADEHLVPAPDDGLAPNGPRRVGPLEYAAIEQLMAKAEQLRGLRFLRPVAVEVEDARAIQAYVHGELEPEELETTRLMYVSLGLLPADLDVEALLLRLLGEQIIGYYDAHGERLVVRDDVMEAVSRKRRGTGAEEVLLHELVHALQDQHFNLGERLKERRTTDADSAFRALIEGDATLAMAGLGLARDGRPLSHLTTNPARLAQLRQLTAVTTGSDPELDAAPAIVRVPLLSAYTDGLVYAARLHGQGGWSAVNAAHGSPPTTSELILHAGRSPDASLAPPRLAPELGLTTKLQARGFRLLKRDTLGELELGVFLGLGQTAKGATSATAAMGWDGDWVEVYQNDETGQLGAAWLTQWDTPRDAREAHEAALAVQRQTPPTTRANASVTRRGRRVLVLRGFAAEAHSSLTKRALGR